MSGTERLRDKVAVVTGANQGIGRAIAEAFAEEGASLMLCDLNGAHLPEIAAAAQSRGVRAAHRVADVTRPEDTEAAMKEAEEQLGAIDVLVNCAGIFQSRKFLDYSLEDWNRIMAVNVTGTFLCCQAALRRMEPKESGKIINLASIAGRMGGQFRSGYSATKHAVIGLTRCLAVEFAGKGITVNAICPGMVDTGMFAEVVRGDAENLGREDTDVMLAELMKRSQQGRFIVPAEIASLAVYLASSDADSMTGQAVTLDGGMVMQ